MPSFDSKVGDIKVGLASNGALFEAVPTCMKQLLIHHEIPSRRRMIR